LEINNHLVIVNCPFLEFKEGLFLSGFGKGRKARIVTLQDAQTVFLKYYMQENQLFEPGANN